MKVPKNSIQITDRVARITSDVFSPPSVFAILGFVVGWAGTRSLWPGLFWGAVYGFFVSLLPLIVVVYLLKIGYISDLHIREREQRNIPYLVSVCGAGVVCIISFYFEGPLLVQALSIGTLFGLSVLTIINFVWLISNHMSSVSMAVFFVGLSFGWIWAVVFSPLIPLVFFSRLHLRRHSVAQLLAGGFAGLVTIEFILVMGLL